MQEKGGKMEKGNKEKVIKMGRGIKTRMCRYPFKERGIKTRRGIKMGKGTKMEKVIKTVKVIKTEKGHVVKDKTGCLARRKACREECLEVCSLHFRECLVDCKECLLPHRECLEVLEWLSLRLGCLEVCRGCLEVRRGWHSLHKTTLVGCPFLRKECLEVRKE